MEFGKHIGTGVWGLAGRALPPLYGVGIIVFVIRTFPAEEFGIYTLLQTVYLLVTAMAQSFALQPLAKFGAGADDVSGPVTACAVLYAAFLLPASGALLAGEPAFGAVFNSPQAGALLWYVPAMLAVAAPRNLAAYLLQAKLRLRDLFVLDALFFAGSLLLIAVLVPAGVVTGAADILLINIATLALSSAWGAGAVFPAHRVRPVFRREELRRVFSYGRYSLGASVSYSLYAQSDNLIVSSVLGPVALAVYGAAKVFIRGYEMALQLITTLLVPAVSKLETAGRRNEITAVAEKSLFLFTAGMGLASAGLAAAAPFLVDAVYGGRYAESVPILILLALSGILIPAIAVGSSYCFALGKMREVFFVNAASSAAGIVLLALGTSAFGLPGAAVAVVATYAAMAVVWIVVLRRSAGVPVTLAGVFSRAGDAPRFIKRSFSGWLEGSRGGNPAGDR